VVAVCANGIDSTYQRLPVGAYILVN